MIYFPSFNHLICPEPGCDYVSEERQDITRHMISDHMSEENTNASHKLFFCLTCSQNLELKSKENFQEHLNLCGHLGNERTQDPAPQQAYDDILDPSDKFVQIHTRRTGTNTYECNHCTIQFDSRDAKNSLRYHLSKFHNFLEEDMSLPSKMLVSERAFLEKRSETNDVIINTNGATEDLEEIKCHLCEFSLLDTEPLHKKNNGRRRMRQHYSMIHKIQRMRLCEKRGCNFRSASFKLNLKHRREEAGHSQCEVCGVQILTYLLEKHKQIHSDRTFDCEYCNRPYGNAGHLK